MGQHVRAGDLDIWTEQVGQGPDVLLLGGLGDTVESWQFQLSVEAFQAQVEVCVAYDTADRLAGIAAPTLVLSGDLDSILPPRFGRAVAAAIPDAGFEVLAGEAHQPFQEAPEEWNARVDPFWREVEAQG